MKRCPKCNEQYSDSHDYCMKCGSKLVEIRDLKSIVRDSNSKPYVMIAVAIILVLSAVIGIAVKDSTNRRNTREAISNYREQKAYEEEASKPSVYDVKISNWNHHKSGHYIYVNGSITNTSFSKSIRYYEIGVKFYDSRGKVIDTDWTNGSDLDPGDTQSFEIMHKYDYSIKDMDVYVKEVK